MMRRSAFETLRRSLHAASEADADAHAAYRRHFAEAQRRPDREEL